MLTEMETLELHVSLAHISLHRKHAMEKVKRTVPIIG